MFYLAKFVAFLNHYETCSIHTEHQIGYITSINLLPIGLYSLVGQRALQWFMGE